MSGFAVVGEWLVQEADGCTCCGLSPHEPGCGYEPLAKLADITDALQAAGYAVIELPSVAYKGPNDTDAMFFRQVADRMETPSRVDFLSGSNVRAAVRTLLYRAADAAERRL